MTTIINASTSNGLVQTADGSGVIKVQSNGVTTNALAWVNFNGTGTVAIRSSYNVSSITDNGTGDYTVNFATALSDANYVICAITATPGTASGFVFPFTTWGTTSASRLATTSTGFAFTDFTYVNVTIFGN
jgi:hypothetical protein